ncbi:alpha-hydroxy acid oxidase [Glaciimonas soli]|uniref:Alpha-hydroxy-acid oxidizing protein n=1 Tax=Glaciimonas soli TaxID=2590999 RepID=A0A843YSQ7_9BURK|nr:alpha-hydroxy acid oxidase [Glaciimonas soli]MQR00754.1 alpha-hydroxy-acid oxidizing protein [Glaciimonas soli]
MNIPADTVALSDYELRFHEHVDTAVAAYIAGAAADGITQRANRQAFDRLHILPRALVDMSQASAKTMLFGETLDYPIILGPTAFHKLVDPAGELATVEAASLTRTWMTVSQQASVTLENVASAASTPLWFQLYMRAEREETVALIRRAESAGYKAIVVTIDAAVSGIRNAEQRTGFRLPEQISAVNLSGFKATPPIRARAGSPVFQGMLKGAPTWADIEWLCQLTALPVIVKGLMNPADVEPALRVGCAGIIVSNHGGRTLDTVPATIAVLPFVTQAVAGRVPVLVDGGVRRGTDILKALALGASAVLIGQPVLHALAVGGMPGVAHMLTVLQTELEVAMALAGQPQLHKIDSSLLWTSPQ